MPLAILAEIVFGALLILLGQIGDEAGGARILLHPAVAFATTALILILLALRAGGGLSMVSVITSQYAAVAVLLGVAFRGQRMWPWQALGLAAASLAVALITIG